MRSRTVFQRGINRVLGGFFRLFNRGFERASERYGRGVRRLTAIRAVVLGVFACLVGRHLGHVSAGAGRIHSRAGQAVS